MSIDYTNYIKPVSIHATLAGGDARLGRCMLTSVCFYPRHPRGWRLSSALPSGTASGFYPRHPRGWRQVGKARQIGVVDVSIHATLAGGDL